jgi:hypothetical protein
MRLFIAREALDAHMRIAGTLLDSHHSPMKRLAAALAAVGRYAVWYPQQWCSWGWWPRHAATGGSFAGHLRFVERTSHTLARALFHSAVRYQTRLAYRQQLLGRLVDIGGDLFAMTAACSKAHAMVRQQPSEQSPVELADLFCRMATRRVRQTLRALRDHDDRQTYRTAQNVLGGRFEWLEHGIL